MYVLGLQSRQQIICRRTLMKERVEATYCDSSSDFHLPMLNDPLMLYSIRPNNVLTPLGDQRGYYRNTRLAALGG
jgi:hypothetical protein